LVSLGLVVLVFFVLCISSDNLVCLYYFAKCLTRQAVSKRWVSLHRLRDSALSYKRNKDCFDVFVVVLVYCLGYF